MDRMFYIRAIRADTYTNLATGIQVIIPDGLSFDEARRVVIDRVTEQLESYFAHECVTACGIPK